MEARQVEKDALRTRLNELRTSTEITLAAVAAEIGVSRTALSQYANNGVPLRENYRTALAEYLGMIASAPTIDLDKTHDACHYKEHLELYQTAEFRDAIGWCQTVTENRRMGVMIGYPGSGKTTILREFGKLTPGARYIECWPGMRMGDLLRAIASAAKITVSGNNYVKAQQLVSALRARTDIVLMFDECEYLKKWDVDKFEIIRKIWDNTGTPVIFAGTQELESILTRGGGRGNLAQLYRRKWEIKLEGVRAEEIRYPSARYSGSSRMSDRIRSAYLILATKISDDGRLPPVGGSCYNTVMEDETLRDSIFVGGSPTWESLITNGFTGLSRASSAHCGQRCFTLLSANEMQTMSVSSHLKGVRRKIAIA